MKTKSENKSCKLPKRFQVKGMSVTFKHQSYEGINFRTSGHTIGCYVNGVYFEALHDHLEMSNIEIKKAFKDLVMRRIGKYIKEHHEA